MADNLRDEEKGFVEDVGVVFERTGLPRMSGRVFGWLLIADPPYQSPSDLAEVLLASKGSISTNLRLLAQLGFIERFVIPGERHDHFRLRGDALRRVIGHGLGEEIDMFLNLAERGLSVMNREPPARRRWLEEMQGRYSFLRKEFPILMERYEVEWMDRYSAPSPGGVASGEHKP